MPRVARVDKNEAGDFLLTTLIQAKNTGLDYKQKELHAFPCNSFKMSNRIDYNSLIQMAILCGAVSSPPKYGYSLYPTAVGVVLSLLIVSVLPLSVNM